MTTLDLLEFKECYYNKFWFHSVITGVTANLYFRNNTYIVYYDHDVIGKDFKFKCIKSIN